MFNDLIMLYVNHHINKDFDYSILFSGVVVKLLSDKYKGSLIRGEVLPLTSLSKEKIYQYAELGDKYKSERNSKEDVMMACYVLDFITNKI
jgi:hypothetical protein